MSEHLTKLPPENWFSKGYFVDLHMFVFYIELDHIFYRFYKFVLLIVMSCVQINKEHIFFILMASPYGNESVMWSGHICEVVCS